MQSRYNDADAAAYVERYAQKWGEALALRVYTSHLIGAEPSLVLHGGGNTSVKDTVHTLVGDAVPALFVKGSGWNLGTIAPEGFPAVDLRHMQRVAAVPGLTDEQMVNEQRTHLFDASSPNPSIETLVHAVIPHTFVDHSHADAILALTNHPDGEAHIQAALGPDVALVPYVKPGFDLCGATLEALKRHPDAKAMVLMQHGLFTWGATAKQAYELHIELVTAAESYLQRFETPLEPRATADEVAQAHDRAAQIVPLLRGVLAGGGGEPRWIVQHRADAELLAWVNSDRLQRWVAAGPLTPDHVIRTKPLAAVVTVPLHALDDDVAVRTAMQQGVEAFRADYRAYVAREAAAAGRTVKELDSTPRVVLVPGVGVFGVGDSPKAARINLDLTRHTLAVKEACEGLGPFEGLPPARLFEVEYWSLEQAKLGKKAPAPLARTVALVTGGAGAIGVGIARTLLDAGAAVVLGDIDADGLAQAEALLGRSDRLATVRMDVTNATSVAWAFQQVALQFGGVDVVVPNAGVAHSRTLAELTEADWRRVVDVNTHGGFFTLREAARQLIRQGSGGHVVVVSTKNVFGPGAAFGAYSASKAATHQLAKVAAMELAPHGVAVNMVNPDAVFSGLGVASGLWQQIGPDRAAAKGLAPDALPEHYRERNLLKATVTARHVGEAVLFFARSLTPTTGASLPVDGGVPAAFPR